jgi:hypothetical protein
MCKGTAISSASQSSFIGILNEKADILYKGNKKSRRTL